METLAPSSHDSSAVIHSRLHFLQDKGGKTRNIAIADQVTQTTFKPLHQAIFKTLKRLRTDGTRDQDLQVQRIYKYLKLNSSGRFRTVKQLLSHIFSKNIFYTTNSQLNQLHDDYIIYSKKDENQFYSIDMKSCTERFPVELQRLCLEYLGFLNEEDSKL